LIEILIHQPEPAYLERISALLLAGKSPRHILDVIQIGAAEIILATETDTNFSLPQHCYEYCNALGWFYDKFDHPQRLKLLYVAASYLNQNAWHQARTGDLLPAKIPTLGGAERMTERSNPRSGRGGDRSRSMGRKASPGPRPTLRAGRTVRVSSTGLP